MASTNEVKSTRGRDRTHITQYKIPLGLSPWAKNGIKDGNVWISMKPKKILDQTTKGAGTYSTDKIPVEFLFMAPLALNESIAHHWEAYESVSSRLAQKARSLVKLANEGKALVSITKNFNERQKAKESEAPKKISSVEDFIATGYGLVPGSKIPKIKVDTPLYYVNSDRRQLIFEFQLFNEAKNKRATDFLLAPIQDLMKFSSPDLINEGGIQIEFPYMWEVKTLPIPFINYSTCALTAVQPTWNSPYVNGYPISCNLQLTFVDLSPLYAGTIEYGSIINVKTEYTDSWLVKDRERESRKIPYTGKAYQRI